MKKDTLICTLIGIILCFSTLGIGVCFGNVNYNYEFDKCENLKHSNYDFTHDIQLNAEYAQDCYWIMNYPYARLIKMFVIPIIVAINVMLIFCIIITLLKMVND